MSADPVSGDERVERVLAEHVYDDEFLGGLGEVWTSCTCGAKIDATFGDGRSSVEVFRANWATHVAAALAPVLAEVRAEALTSLADEIDTDDDLALNVILGGASYVTYLLRDRAAAIEGGAS
jgi:hypothetical protein